MFYRNRRIQPLRAAKFYTTCFRGVNYANNTVNLICQLFSEKLQSLTDTLEISTIPWDIHLHLNDDKFAVRILVNGVKFRSDKQFIAIKTFIEPDHLTIILVNNSDKIIEWFNSDYYESKVYETLKNWCSIEFEEYKFVSCNDNYFAQDSIYDEYCQTYMFYYLYHRVIKSEDMQIIIKRLGNYTPDRRVDLIRNFYHFFN